MVMDSCTIALFGEAEKGDFETAYYCHSLPELVDYLGNPPPNSCGLFCAVRALLYDCDLLFFRVKEEGFSFSDYLSGLHLLEKQKIIPHISAVCLPGVGDPKIMQMITPFCKSHQSLILTTEGDLYDYLTDLS